MGTDTLTLLDIANLPSSPELRRHLEVLARPSMPATDLSARSSEPNDIARQVTASANADTFSAFDSGSVLLSSVLQLLLLSR